MKKEEARMAVVFRFELFEAEIDWVQNHLNCRRPEAIKVMREKIKQLLHERLMSQMWTLFEGSGKRRDRLEFSVRGEDLESYEEAIYEGACGWWFPK